MARSSEPARQAIIAAAEQLFAERGVEGPTLREIGAAAGQRNNSAVQYHFGDRAGLLAAVLRPHLDELDATRRRLLDRLDASGQPASIDTLVDILVQPLAAKLAQESGVRYLHIQAALLGSGESAHDTPPSWSRPAMVEVISRIGQLVPVLPDDEIATRQLLVLTVVFNGLANRSAMGDDGPPVDVYVRTLRNAVRSLLTTP